MGKLLSSPEDGRAPRTVRNTRRTPYTIGSKKARNPVQIAKCDHAAISLSFNTRMSVTGTM